VRILAVNWRDIENPEAGGAEVHLHEILSHLVRWGHEATQISTGYPGCEAEVTIDGIRVLRHGRWYNANFRLPLFARRHMRNNEYDVVIEDINKLPFFMPLYTDAPVVPVVPHLFGSTAYLETNALIASYVYVMEKFIPLVFRKNRFIVISPSTKDDLVERGIEPERISVVLCGLDHDRYRNLNLDRFEQPTIVHLGRLRKYKSVDVIMRSMTRITERIPDARLVIIGDGPYRPRLEREARDLGLGGKIEFAGYLDHEELVEFLNRSHLLLNPSPKEGWGLTVVEANACGLPVIASDRPGLRDSVWDGETGFLVPYGDEEEFARRSIALLQDGELWHRMSRRAIERVDELKWERCAREMETELGRIAEVKP
jgi:glycosyltransferase involved in cell wall biosynthesis